MRRILWLLALAGCEPSIGSGTYWCGPEQLCPPHLACNPNSFTCERPSAVQPFACPADSEGAEPDDGLESALELGELGCGDTALMGGSGCIDDGGDVDYVEIEVRACAGQDPHLDVRLWFPIALVPLELVLLDEAGAEVATGGACAAQTSTGMTTLCLELLPAPGTYYLRIQPATVGGSGDCGGACRFNQYLLDVRFPLA